MQLEGSFRIVVVSGLETKDDSDEAYEFRSKANFTPMSPIEYLNNEYRLNRDMWTQESTIIEDSLLGELRSLKSFDEPLVAASNFMARRIFA